MIPILRKKTKILVVFIHQPIYCVKQGSFFEPLKVFVLHMPFLMEKGLNIKTDYQPCVSAQTVLQTRTSAAKPMIEHLIFCC